MVGRNNGGLGPQLFLRVVVKVAEVDVGEVHLGATVAGRMQCDPAASEDLPEVVIVSLVGDVSADRNGLHQPALRITQRFVILAEPALAAAVLQVGEQSMGSVARDRSRAFAEGFSIERIGPKYVEFYVEQRRRARFSASLS